MRRFTIALIFGIFGLLYAACGGPPSKPLALSPKSDDSHPALGALDQDSTEPLTLDDAPACKEALNDFIFPALTDCWRALFRPLQSAPLPFPSHDYAEAGVNGFAVAPGWLLTALHVWRGSCFRSEYLYAESPVNIAGCGTALIVGGHPQTLNCRDSNTSMGVCVDQVPFAEAFDIGLFAHKTGLKFLPLAKSSPKVGDQVFLIGNPAIVQSRIPEYAGKPLVSYGKVRKVDGRGIVVSNLAHPGNSGGPILNIAGEVIGVVYTGIRMQRQQHVVIDPDLEEWDTVGLLIDDEIRTAVKKALSGTY